MNRNPCLTSGLDGGPCELAGQCKDNPTCKKCQLKTDYWTGDNCPCSYSDTGIDGNGGFNLDDLNYNYQAPECNDEVENYINTVCLRAGITVEELRCKGRKIKVSHIRREIARILYSPGWGMSKAEIGPLVGTSPYTVVQYVIGMKNPATE